MPAALLVLRHGQSTWNAEGRWQGRQDPPLSSVGVQQARAAAAVLGQFDAIVTSHLKRAAMTADIIAIALGVGPVTVDEDLGERHAGHFEGLTRPEIEERWPGWLAAKRRPDGWEDDEVVLRRSAGALGRVAAGVGDGGTALVVAHGGVLRVLDAATGATVDGPIPNLSGRWFEVGPGRLVAGDEVHALVDGAQTPGGVTWQV